MNYFIIQNSAIEKLSRLKAGALFMKMGTGKTKTALNLASSKRNDFKYVIWIAPASLIRSENYQNEINKWKEELDIKFFTIEGVSASDAQFLRMHELISNNDTFCILDESLTIKNSESGRTKRLLYIWHLFKFRLILNGTPLTQGLIDLYSQIQFIHPNILKMSEAQFANNFLQYKKEGYKPWKRWSKPENEQALIEIIRPYIFDAELDIPVNLIEEDIYVNLNQNEWQEYNDFKENYLQNNSLLEFLAIAQKFQHFYTLCQEKGDYVKHLLATVDNAIFFVKFKKEISFLKEIIPEALIYNGDRKDNLKKGNFLIASYGCGSKGLNLQRFNNIIFFSQTFDYAHKEHGLHRVYRMGQTKDVKVYNIWINTGLEKAIRFSLDKKECVLKNVKNIISKEGVMAL